MKVCQDYNRLPDGIFDELDLALARGPTGEYAIRQVDVVTFEQR